VEIIHCGDGSQPIRWACDVAMQRIDPNYGMNMGLIHEIKMESGSLVNPKGIISSDLQEDCTIIV